MASNMGREDSPSSGRPQGSSIGGSSSSSSRSGAGGAGGVRNSSSGTRESAGSRSTSSGSSGSRSSGNSTGNTSRGGSSLGGGLSSAANRSSSGNVGSNGAGSSRAGAGSGPSRSGANGAAGLASAARAAYNGGSRSGGLSVGTYSGPKGVGSLNSGARMAAANTIGFGAPRVSASPREIDAMARMMLAESQSIKNARGGLSMPALQAVGDVIRNRVVSERFPNSVMDVLSQKGQFSPYEDGSFANITPANPNYASARAVAESILSGESPSVVGGELNYGNLHTINNGINPQTGRPYSSSRTRQQFNEMAAQPGAKTFADARNPNEIQHTFGTIGPPTDVNFNGSVAPRANPQMPALAAAGQPWERAQAIPSPREAVNGFLGGISGTPPSPSTFPGRPMEMAGAFPGAAVTSNFPGRPGVVGPGFPAAQAASPSTFPGRPELSNGFVSAVAGRPEFPGSLPAANGFVTDNFPGRPEFPGSFPAAQQMVSSFPGRPETIGPGFPAAPEPHQNPGRSYAGLPSSGFPQAPQPQQTTTAEAPPTGGLWGAISSGLTNASNAVTGAVEQAKPYADMAWENLDNPMLQVASWLSGLGSGKVTSGNAGSNAGGQNRNEPVFANLGEKKNKNNTPAQPDRLPWETTGPTTPGSYPTMPFAPPALVSRDRPQWSWGTWA